MKTWFWLLLIMVTLTVGCAPGYSAKKAAYPGETSGDQAIGKGYENPESGGEQDARIWHEEAGR